MMDNEKNMIITCGIIIAFYVILLFLRNRREKQKNEVLTTGMVANLLTLEMVQTYMEDPINIGEEETDMVKHAVNMALDRNRNVLDIVMKEVSDEVKNNLLGLIIKRGEKNE
jgi:hypothetical protein